MKYPILLLSILIFSCACEREDPPIIPPDKEENYETPVQDTQLADFAFLNLPAGVDMVSQFSWDNDQKILTFNESLSFSTLTNPDFDQEGFYWEIPEMVYKIVIAKNVTITGGFRTYGPVEIRGEERTTSRIFGTDTKEWALGPNGETDSECGNRAGDDRAHDCEKWSYGAVSPANGGSYAITVKNLTIENMRTYAITSFSNPLVIDSVHIINTRPTKSGNPDYKSNSDGIGGGPGSVVTNTLIDTWDDGIKLYRDFTVRNVTIVHNANGAPFQLGWSQKSATNHIIENVKIVVPASGPTKSNLAMVSASLTSGSVNATLKIEGKGLYADYTTRAGLLIRTNDPMPITWMKSPDAKVTFDLQGDASIVLKAPAGTYGLGSVEVSGFCNEITMLQANINCANGELATGAPF